MPHNVRFQATQVLSASHKPTAEPNQTTATCSTAIAIPNPSKPQAEWASTAAVGGPPIRGCRITMMLVKTTGYSAMMPLILGPTQPDVETTMATRVATSAARIGTSYQRRVTRG